MTDIDAVLMQMLQEWLSWEGSTILCCRKGMLFMPTSNNGEVVVVKYGGGK